ncbi:hypothetical protein PFISCL1PPCAC_24778 [Pristionchus fissidentatus]|uniref:Uncharacterized protein n=1 Tax=Pristionchus fissidentatus TaxID=1538716 RepID=A0AAV5WMG1_9BILA|nr:hypothetical protein PFISCL1PPCAC_24778 [Pristionchus fissidentatus]
MFYTLLISLLLYIHAVIIVNGSDDELGGSSVSGVGVTCHAEMEACLASCEMSCYVVDHCNDSPGEMVACAPNVVQMILLTLGVVGIPGMIVLTLIFVVVILGCCCTVCFCSPCCLCAILMKKRRDRNQREAATQSGLALLSKA